MAAAETLLHLTQRSDGGIRLHANKTSLNIMKSKIKSAIAPKLAAAAAATNKIVN